MKTTIILGNGFDLDLGLNTSYRDFVQSEIFDKLLQTKHNHIINSLDRKYQLQNWVDVECELRDIAQALENNTYNAQSIQADYTEFLSLFGTYIAKIQKDASTESLNETSLAANLLHAIDENPQRYEIYTFNFTNLMKIGEVLKCSTRLSCHHIHGKIEDGSHIMGFNDDAKDVDTQCCMIKTFNPNYRSSHLRRALRQAKEIIIFGHSLGETDYPYFKEFFKEKSSPDMKEDEAVKLSIVTANEASRMAIMKQLRTMNDNRTNILLDQNDVQFYYTKTLDSRFRFHQLLQRLKAEKEAERILGI